MRPGLPHRNVIVERQVDRLREPRGRQLHQLARGKRDRRQAIDRRIPTARRGVKGIKQVAIKAYDEAHPDAQAEGNDDKDSK